MTGEAAYGIHNVGAGRLRPIGERTNARSVISDAIFVFCWCCGAVFPITVHRGCDNAPFWDGVYLEKFFDALGLVKPKCPVFAVACDLHIENPVEGSLGGRRKSRVAIFLKSGMCGRVFAKMNAVVDVNADEF